MEQLKYVLYLSYPHKEHACKGEYIINLPEIWFSRNMCVAFFYKRQNLHRIFSFIMQFAPEIPFTPPLPHFI